MTAEIVSVGTELLLGDIVDSHAATMARILADCGIGCQRRATVGDNLPRIVSVLRESLERADAVITIGGLGPTGDDLTRDAIAEALGDRLVRVPDLEEKLHRFFSSRNIPWLDSIARQALRPESAELIENPNGTAPGLHCSKNGKEVIALPGPKGEFDPMAHGPVREILCRLAGAGIIRSRTLRIVGLGESQVEHMVRDLMDSDNPTLAPYAKTGEVHLRVTARANSADEAEGLIDPVEAEIKTRLGAAVFGTDETSLEEAVLHLLMTRRETLSVAESMTGGELGGRLTDVPGSSTVFKGGVMAYSPAAKLELLGVSVEPHGPVSAEVAKSMAEGVRNRLQATWGVSITGNAGPDVDIDDKPVGLVFIGVAGPGGTQIEQAKYRGVREDIRRRACQLALATLRANLL